MNNIWQIIAKLGIELHPERIELVASRIRTLNNAQDFDQIKSSFGPNVDKSLISQLKKVWISFPEVTPKELSVAMLSASQTSMLYERRSAVELVWTGPTTGLVPVRHTEQVLRQVIQSSKRRLFIVSYVAYKVNSIIQALQDAIDRQVQISILLEQQGERVTVDSVKNVKQVIPTANIYVWNDNVDLVQRNTAGVVHAKCAVADGKVALITSANLTDAAMERNMELGVLFKGGALPEKLDRHLEALVSTGIIMKV